MAEPELLIAGWSDYAVGDAELVFQRPSECAEISRGEEGCLAFSVTTDPSRPGRITVFERWVSTQQHSTHLSTDHVKRYREQVSAVHHLRRSLHRYLVSDSQEL